MITLKIKRAALDKKTLIRVGTIFIVIILLIIYNSYLNKNNSDTQVSSDGTELKELDIESEEIQELYERVRIYDYTKEPNDYYNFDEIVLGDLTNTVVSYIMLNYIDFDVTVDESICTNKETLATLSKQDINENLETLFGSEYAPTFINTIFIGHNRQYDKIFNLVYSKASDNYVLTCQNSSSTTTNSLENKLKHAYISDDGTEIKIVEKYTIANENEKTEKGDVTFSFKVDDKNNYYLYKINRSKE